MQDNPAPFSVLVADAEPTICRVFEAKLTKEGRYRVACASSGPDAYRLALQQSFDIVLWDLRMRDSEVLLPRLRALCTDAALLLMSTDDQPAVNVTIARLDIAGVLVKPFGLDTLENHIGAALQQRRRQQPLYQVGFVGQFVTLRTPAGRCLTRVFENTADTFLVVGSPRVVTPPDFAVGQKVQVEYNGKGAVYSFDSTLLREIPEPLPCWELAMPDIIRRTQRRRSPRTPLQKPIKFGTPEEGAELPFDGTTTDISSTGLALVSANPTEAGTQIQFALTPEVSGLATVVWSQPQATPDGGATYRIALRFDEVPSLAKAYLESWLDK